MSAAECELHSAVQVHALGASLALALPLSGTRRRQALCIYLSGELGAGKTTLCRGFLQALGHHGAVRSPTYTLAECYELGPLCISHLDLYRLDDPGELEDLGVRDYFADCAACLIEWPERAGSALPAPDLRLQLDYLEDDGRRCRIETALLNEMQLQALVAGAAHP